ncbi:MAG: amidohydrolase family protein [Spirochaetales bacterium]|uniref:Amidohydrolase family protein n=1 Tax=Candidatus Thalassospirochaeta sargassi TaxID=3119039 RepID=A0AAJ1IID3_9SPIO|nr:amidohydrolase family protein [Spirochaetales bacterium]
MTSFILKNCSLINGRADIDIKHGVSLGVGADGLIKEIVSGNSTVESYSEEIDLNGCYLVPGIINAHAHLIASGKPSIGFNKSTRILLKFLSTGPGRKLAGNMIKRNITNAVNAGVTTIRSLGDPLYYDIAVRNELKDSGDAFPRLLTAGRLICASGGHGDMLTPLTADSPWECRKAVRMNDQHSVDVIKLISTGGVTDARKIGQAGCVHMTVEEIAAVCDEAHRRGLMVACHAESSLGVKEALLGGVDTIEHGSELDRQMIDLFLKNPNSLRGYSAYIPTLSAPVRIMENRKELTSWDNIKFANAEIVMKGQIKAVNQAVEAGVKIGCGADSGVPFVSHYDVWNELRFLMEHAGLTAAGALEVGTIATAEILGIDGITGSLDVGKAADIIVTADNPLEDLSALSKPRMVAAQGRLVRRPQIKKAF